MKVLTREDWFQMIFLSISAVFVALVVAIASGTLNISSGLKLSKGVFLVGLVGGSLLTGLINWRLHVKFLLFAIVIEGALRKWILPEQSSIIYFAKDCLVLCALPGYFLWKTHAPRDQGLLSCWKQVYLLVIILLLYGLVQLLNPRLSHIGVGIIGIKSYFIGIPLVFLARDMFDSEAEVNQLFREFLAFSIPIFVLGMIQFFHPPTHALNRYVWGEDPVAIFGAGRHPRITGTFSYLAGMGTYIPFIFCFVIGSLFCSAKSAMTTMVDYGILALSVGTVFMTGSRAPAFQISVCVLLTIVYFGRNTFLFFQRYFLRALLICTVVSFVMIKWFPSAVKSFTARVTQAGYSDAQERVAQFIQFPEVEFKQAGWIGYGIGSTQQASAQLLTVMGLEPTDYAIDADYEEEPERVMLELGLIGFFLFYALKFGVTLCCWKVFQKSDYPPLKWVAFGSFVFVVISLFSSLVFNHVLNVFYWYSVGLLAAVHRISVRSHEIKSA